MTVRPTQHAPLLVLFLATSLLASCRGGVSTTPPIHPNWNMDQQNRLDPYEPFAFFAVSNATGQGAPLGASARPRIEGTVASGTLEKDDHLYRGKTADGYAMGLPPNDDRGNKVVLDVAFLKRGQDRFNIYCAPCHDRAGTGQGIVVLRGFIAPVPPSFHEARVLSKPIGALYETVTNGFGAMGPYKGMIPVMDRWRIAAYVRTLQHSRSAPLEVIPDDQVASKRWGVR